VKTSLFSQFVLNGFLPFFAPEDSGGEGGETNANPGGKTKGAVTFKDQETFDALIASRVDQAKRAWEKDEKPAIVAAVTDEVKAAIKADAEREAAEKSGEFQKLYSTVLDASDPNAIPKESRLYQMMETLIKERDDRDSSINALVEDEAKSLSDQMKTLIPEGYSPQKKLDWIRNAKKAAADTVNTRNGNTHKDPNPSNRQGRTVEDVMRELGRGNIPYGSHARQSAGASSDGGSN
jgi:hypothetical protein